MASRAHTGIVEGGSRRGLLGARRELSEVLPFVAADARLRWAGKVVAAALAVGMLLSPALWLTRPGSAPLSDSFPLVPPLSGLRMLALPAPLDSFLFAGVLALCALGAVTGRRVVFGALFFGCLLLVLPDMMRWQPWTYLYLAALGTLAFVPAREAGGIRGWIEPLQVMRLLVGCVYLWSGANKLNASFFEERLSGFLAGLPLLLSDGPAATALTYSAPLAEIAAGLGMLFGGFRVRHLALAGAASTNLLVLVALVPAGSNSVVWPWNLAMIGLVAILFAGRDEKKEASPQQAPRRRTRARGTTLGGYFYALLVVALVSVMPFFGVLGLWPSYLSWALYSENTSEAVVRTDGGEVGVTAIAYEHLNVPAYPSPAVYEAVAERACALRGPGAAGEAALVVWDRPDILDGQRTQKEYICSP